MTGPIDDDRLVAMFCTTWKRTGDLEASLRVIYDTGRLGATKALARGSRSLRVSRRRAMLARSMESAVARGKAIASAAPALRTFARECRVQVDDVLTPVNTPDVVTLRYEAMWVLRQAKSLSYPVTAQTCGYMNHSDAIRGCRVVEQRMASDPALRRRLQRLVVKCRGAA